jgi:hypothetical protein
MRKNIFLEKLCPDNGLNPYIIHSMASDEEDLCALRDYVRAMITNGYDALELEAFAKKFKHMDHVRLLQKLGCDVHEDIVLLRLPEVEDDYDDDYMF